jgi:hypothetical protein
LIFFIISFFIPSLFLLFYKNYYYFSKGRETAQSPKPAVSLPLNPSLFGHGLGRCPKNLIASEVNTSSKWFSFAATLFHTDLLKTNAFRPIFVRSVSYEQIRVAIFPHIKKGCL